MLRFILKRTIRDNISGGYESEAFVTVDVNVPEVERLLCRGGYGENGFDATRLIGVEIHERGDIEQPEQEII